MKQTKKRKPFVPLFARVTEEHLEKLAARAKREGKGQGELIRELLDRHL